MAPRPLQTQFFLARYARGGALRASALRAEGTPYVSSLTTIPARLLGGALVSGGENRRTNRVRAQSEAAACSGLGAETAQRTGGSSSLAASLASRHAHASLRAHPRTLTLFRRPPSERMPSAKKKNEVENLDSNIIDPDKRSRRSSNPPPPSKPSRDEDDEDNEDRCAQPLPACSPRRSPPGCTTCFAATRRSRGATRRMAATRSTSRRRRHRAAPPRKPSPRPPRPLPGLQAGQPACPPQP